ncbi:MAG: ABC transporter substrate-binding protein [Actinomycetaceae bacterium]|nr:ABC transporter substrate-binding protein [Actinomycetaceae bacterium]
MRVLRTLQAITVAALALALGACSAPPATDSGQENTEGAKLPSATIGLTYIPNVQFSPFYMAEDQGFFIAEGAQVKLRHHGQNEGLFTALVGGEEDAVVAFGDEMAQAMMQDPSLELVAIAQVYAQYPVEIIVNSALGATTIQDLKGKTIGLPGRFGSSWFGLQAALAQAGMTLEDVNIAEIGYTQQAQMASNQVDAVVGFVNNDSVRFKLAGMDVTTIPLAPNTPLVAADLVTTKAFAQKNPDAVRAMAKGSVKGIEAVIADPNKALEVTKKYDPTLATEESLKAATEILAATVKVLTPSEGKKVGEQDLDTWTDMLGFLKTLPGAFENEPATLDVKTLVTNEYLS